MTPESPLGDDKAEAALLDATFAALDDDPDFAAHARREHFAAEMSGSPMEVLITWRGRVPKDLAPILESIIEYRRAHPDR